jgi:hypothetical protein
LKKIYKSPSPHPLPERERGMMPRVSSLLVIVMFLGEKSWLQFFEKSEKNIAISFAALKKYKVAVGYN